MKVNFTECELQSLLDWECDFAHSALSYDWLRQQIELGAFERKGDGRIILTQRGKEIMSNLAKAGMLPNIRISGYKASNQAKGKIVN